MYYLGLLLLLATMVGCKHEISSTKPVDLPPTRVIATVYAVQAQAGEVTCYLEPNANAAVVTVLKNGDSVDLVDVKEGITRRGDTYWLHVYPRLSHRPSCYIDVQNLVPMA